MPRARKAARHSDAPAASGAGAEHSPGPITSPPERGNLGHAEPTPGPWRVWISSTNGSINVVNARNAYVCLVGNGTTGEGRARELADAHLIASVGGAAPRALAPVPAFDEHGEPIIHEIHASVRNIADLDLVLANALVAMRYMEKASEGLHSEYLSLARHCVRSIVEALTWPV